MNSIGSVYHANAVADRARRHAGLSFAPAAPERRMERSMQSSDTPGAAQAVSPLAAVPERSSGDHLLRLLQQHHVQL
jgi:hypothetical protein